MIEGFRSILTHNNLQDGLLSLLFGLATTVFLLAFRQFLAKRISALTRRTKTILDDLLTDVLGETRLFFILILSVGAASFGLWLPPGFHRFLHLIVISAWLLQAAFWGDRALHFLISQVRDGHKRVDASTLTTLSAMTILGRVALWTTVFLVMLDNIGFNVTALITGLGIGGIAVALALQSILGDLFASLTIILDKPFVIGDFIIVDQFLGIVENIGIKTTRVRSLSGEQVIFANSDLLGSRIRNYKRMYERRVVSQLGIAYETPIEKVQHVPQIIRSVIENLDSVRFDRAHFKRLGDTSLEYEYVYYVLVPDYKVYIQREETINLELMKRFDAEGIAFAYPTQTVHLIHDNLPEPKDKQTDPQLNNGERRDGTTGKRQEDDNETRVAS